MSVEVTSDLEWLIAGKDGFGKSPCPLWGTVVPENWAIFCRLSIF